MAEATPRPWAMTTAEDVKGDLRSITIERRGPSGVTVEQVIARIETAINGKANGEFILRAVNAHDDLLAACKAIVKAWYSIPERDQVNDEMNVDSMWDDARAAIAKAEGKS